jgi:hypothetical protein
MNPMPEKFAFEMVSRVYLLTSAESLGLRQPHPAHQVGVTGVGTHPRPERVYREEGHASRVL